MKPTEKSPEIERLLTFLTGKDRKNTIENGNCVFCGGAADEFRDEISAREYRISGICQSCQDKTFGRYFI